MTEKQIEADLIRWLSERKYICREDIQDRASLEQNFRSKFEQLNRIRLSDSEFQRLLENIVRPDVFEASDALRQHHHFEREDGTPFHYTLVNLENWCKNSFEVVRQLRMNTRNSHQRYDVILLINGLPLVQIELKRFAISPRKAMEQIVAYKKEKENGYERTLLCFMQIFIVSNRTETWYFANNNDEHFRFDADEQFLPLYQFADKDNKKIIHLESFAKTFLAKCALAQTINRYMVLVKTKRQLMMMRPYQIYAVQQIVACIKQNCGNGYIWHTTGSGKTLTSFKASTLLKENPDIHKCLFVVDRKDLDRQTREEFNKFQEGCVEENTNTETLVRRLLSDNYADKVIVSTIQKLGLALSENGKNNKETYKQRLKPLRDERIVCIFDECHRSQFGKNHEAIKEFFPKAQLFGFTGTPIFEENATSRQYRGNEGSYKTTKELFHNPLHNYTITNAIDDENVLRFRIEYYGRKGNARPQNANPPKKDIVRAILDKHDKISANRMFNAILATASINDAIEYHARFKAAQEERQKENPAFEPLRIACIFSPPAQGDSDVRQLQEDLLQEKADNAVEPEKKKQALQAIIADYNAQYRTNYRIDEFDHYYQDVQKRIKDQQYANEHVPHNEKIDVTIVVDMLLTGFDSKYLNTLYVDKNLRHHSLIQAFSRTNRVLNHTKPFGNIVDFRGQEDKVDEAVVLFSGGSEKAEEVWLVEDAEASIAKLENAVQDLRNFMHGQGLDAAPHEVANLKGDEARVQFMKQCKEVQRLKTRLNQYTELDDGQKQAIEQIMPHDELQGFKGAYLELAHRFRAQQGESAERELPQTDFELSLFASVVIDYDYIMKLIAKYSGGAPSEQKMNRKQIVDVIAADAKFLGEREDLAAYIDTLKAGETLSETQVRKGYEHFKQQKHAREIAALSAEHGLEAAALTAFVDKVLLRMIFDDGDLTDVIAPLGLGWKARKKKKEALMERLGPMLEKRAEGREIRGLGVYDF